MKPPEIDKSVAAEELGANDPLGGYSTPARTWANRAGTGLVRSISDSAGSLTTYGLSQMRLMAATDDTVGAMLWCIYCSLSQTEWAHQPCVDGEPAPTDKKAVRMASLMDGMMHGMVVPWEDHVEEFLTMLPQGFAPCEINLMQRDDGMWALEDVPLRDQLTVVDWKYDAKGVPTAMRQQANGPIAEIPTWKLLHYRGSAVLRRPQGRSIFSNAHRPWYLKNRIQDSEAIGIDRELAGLPVFRMPQSELDLARTKVNGEYTPEAKGAQGRIAAAKQAVSRTRLNENDGIVLPSDTFAEESVDGKDRTPKYDFRIMTSAGPRSIDTRGPIRDYDMAIARVALMQFLQLGTKTNVQGVSSDLSEVAFNSLTAIARKLTGEWNKKTIALIWLMNALPEKYRPRLVAAKINKEGLQQMGAFLNGIGRSIELWQDDARARSSILDAAGIEYDPDAQARRAAADKTPATSPAMKPAGQTGGQTSENP